jgi:tetratricopeptide (TPR) repeat protein/predicted Ser/Thr protein kinase
VNRTGRQVGTYRVEELLGRGASGEVYAAWDVLLERAVALKFLHHERSAPAHDALLREARLLCRLDHPNVCRVYDLEIEQGHDVLVLERIPGAPLGDHRDDLPRERALELAAQIAKALAAAHEVGVVHRDLKPENVLVSHAGVVKVLDFGLAVLLDQPAEPPAGSLDWMSPEQARGEPVGAASDLYALGLVLYWLLLGGLPNPPSDRFADRLAARRRGALALDPHLRRSDRALLEALFAVDPAARPTAAEAARRLDLLAGFRRRRRTRRLRVAALTGLLLGAGITASWWSERRDQRIRQMSAARTIALTAPRFSGGPRERALLDGFHEALAQRLRKLRGIAVVDVTSLPPPTAGTVWPLDLSVRALAGESPPEWEIEAALGGPERGLRTVLRGDPARSFTQLGDWIEDRMGLPRGVAAELRDPFALQLFAHARQETALRGFVAAQPFYEALTHLEPNLVFAHVQLANGLWQSGKVAEAEAIWNRLLERPGLTAEERAEVLYNLVFSTAERHDRRATDELLASFAALLAENPTVETAFLEARAMTGSHFGAPAAATPDYRRLLELYTAQGNAMAHAGCVLNLADSLIQAGEADEAAALVTEATRLADLLASERLHAYASMVRAQWANLTGDAATSRSALERAGALAEALADEQLAAEVRNGHLLAELRFADHDAAGAAWSRVETRARALELEGGPTGAGEAEDLRRVARQTLALRRH